MAIRRRQCVGRLNHKQNRKPIETIIVYHPLDIACRVASRCWEMLKICFRYVFLKILFTTECHCAPRPYCRYDSVVAHGGWAIVIAYESRGSQNSCVFTNPFMKQLHVYVVSTEEKMNRRIGIHHLFSSRSRFVLVRRRPNPSVRMKRNIFSTKKKPDKLSCCDSLLQEIRI